LIAGAFLVAVFAGTFLATVFLGFATGAGAGVETTTS